MTTTELDKIEIIAEIYDKIIDRQTQMQNRTKYFEEVIDLNKKYNIDYSKETEMVQESKAKYEILDCVLNDIVCILDNYNMTITELKKEIEDY